MSVSYLHRDKVAKPSSSGFPEDVTVIHVLIADAQGLFSDALARCLADWEDFEVLADRPLTGVRALHTALEHKPDVALIDYWLAEMDGPVIARELLARLPDTKVIHLSWFHGPDQVEASLASGAVGFLPKSLSVPQVAEAIHRAVGGERPVFEERLSRMVDAITQRADYIDRQASRFNTLTARELGVLRELAGGYTVDQIGRRLGITYGTARTHVRRIVQKTQARSQLEVVAMAKEQGLVP